MNKKDSPRGLDPMERREWHALCDRLFALYRKMPMGETSRKVVAGGDEDENSENMLMFFRGTKDDLFRLREFLGEIK